MKETYYVTANEAVNIHGFIQALNDLVKRQKKLNFELGFCT